PATTSVRSGSCRGALARVEARLIAAGVSRVMGFAALYPSYKNPAARRMGRAKRNPSPRKPSPPLPHHQPAVIDTTPIRRPPPLGHVSMQRRIRPIHGPRDVSMLHRVEVDVIDVPLQIVLVADQMLPISPLPEAAFALGDAACAAMLASWNVARKPALELAQAQG